MAEPRPQFRFPLYFLAHPGGRMPVFRDAARRRWFFLFSDRARAEQWLAGAEPGSRVMPVDHMKPVWEFVRKNRGAGFVFNPSPGGTCEAVLPLSAADAEPPAEAEPAVPNEDLPTLHLGAAQTLTLRRPRTGAFTAVHKPEVTTAAAQPVPEEPLSLPPEELFPSLAGQPQPGAAAPQNAPAPLDSLEPVIPGYEILGELGRGGMGVVYKARQVGLDRAVALKMIRMAEGADGSDRARFFDEAAAVARMIHPNIVQIYEVGEHGGRPYFSLEYVEGGTLSRKTAGVAQPPQRAAEWILTLAQAMHYAHTRNIAHLDLKPANILVTPEGVLKIADFGLARRLDTDADGAADVGVSGTPGYMAPEQLGTEDEPVGPPADIHALGAVLYQLLTGRPPYMGATVADTLDQLIHFDPTPPSRLQSGIPRDLEIICLKCLRKSPMRRYKDASALADDLRLFLEGEPIKSRPVSRFERSVRWCKRNPAAAGITAAVILGLVSALWHLSRLSEQLVRSTARDSAAQESEMLDAVNAIYASEVIDRVKPHGIQVRADYRDKPGAVPLPATLTIHLGKHISKTSELGMQVRLYSDHPFRTRTDIVPPDAFERDALAKLRINPAEPVYSFEEVNGRASLRYASARVMRKACVDCHNSHPDSIKTDWKVGEVRGALEIIRPLDKDAQRVSEGLRGTFVLAAAVAVSLLGLCGAVVFLTRPKAPVTAGSLRRSPSA